MPMPLLASPWIATPLDELMYSAHTTGVVHVFEVASATPLRRTRDKPIAIGSEREMRMREPFEAWCECMRLRRGS